MFKRSMHICSIPRWIALLVFLSAITTSAFAGAGEVSGHGNVNDVMVRVDGDPITRGDILRRILINKGDIDPSKMEPDKWQGMMQTATKSEIIDRLLLKAARSENMKIEPEKLETFIKQKTKRFGQDRLKEILGLQNAATEQEFKEAVHKKMLIEEYRVGLVGNITIENKEVKNYYEENKSTFNRPDRVRLEMLVMDKSVDADALYVRVKKGEDFEKVVHEAGNNETSSIERRFIWTTYNVRPESMGPKLKEGEKGDILVPFLVNDKYYIMKILEKRPAGTAGFDEVEDRIREVLKRNKETVTILSWYETRVRDHKIEYVKE
ncbi:MAG: peptidyl-prolyl cis-trans isomerase [Nitrospiraceae bacterium]|nr:MAG: peptidyl-prolyl cis-trans isomerase [Nitrospiraceae bacterium]